MANKETQKPQEIWFCIGQSGHTADGRNYPAEWFKQAADTYDPEKYTARINIEHFHSNWSVETDYNGYGDVLETRYEEDDDGTVRVFARLSPTEKLLELNKKDIKVFSSMEMQPEFAGTTEVYLVGLALTDTPASLGTSRIKFSKSNPNPNNQYSEQILMTLKTEPENKETPNVATTSDGEKISLGFIERMAALFNKKEAPQPQEVPTSVAAELVQPGITLAVAESIVASIENLSSQVQKLSSENAELVAKMATIEATPAEPERLSHTGAPDYTAPSF